MIVQFLARAIYADSAGRHRLDQGDRLRRLANKEEDVPEVPCFNAEQ